MTRNTHPGRHCFFYDGIAASDANENRHPQVVVAELAETHGFRVLAAVPQSMFDGWDFWIDVGGQGPAPKVTPYFKAKAWKPLGEV